MRSVLFVDPPAFCATVERLVAPALRYRPLAVAPPGADRATVLAISEEAAAAGVVRGMAVRLARKRCPDLVVLPPNPRLYARAARALDDILRHWAPVIEPRWYGHAFLDLSGTERLFGPAVDVAARIRREAWERLGLPLTVGIATNKLVSEAGTRTVRGSDGRTVGDPLQVVAPGSEATFLAPYHVRVLPEIPEPVRRRLDDYQLEVIGEIAAIPETDLCAVFGSVGRTLRTRARGIDPRPVLPPEVRAEYRLEHVLATDTNDVGVLHALLRRLTEQLGRRLRRRGLIAERLTVGVDYVDYRSAVREVPLRKAALDVELWDASRRGLALAMGRRLAVRRVEVTVDRLAEADLQLELWTDRWTDGRMVRRSDGQTVGYPPPRATALQQAIDRIKTRWSSDDRHVKIGYAADLCT
jgi:DNA polymerase-4